MSKVDEHTIPQELNDHYEQLPPGDRSARCKIVYNRYMSLGGSHLYNCQMTCPYCDRIQSSGVFLRVEIEKLATSDNDDDKGRLCNYCFRNIIMAIDLEQAKCAFRD